MVAVVVVVDLFGVGCRGGDVCGVDGGVSEAGGRGPETGKGHGCFCGIGFL